MASVVAVGCQRGDCGKAKLADYLAEQFRVQFRANGGPNAGRTSSDGSTTHRLQLTPESMLRKGGLAMVGPYVVCDLEVLVREAEIARQHGARVVVDGRAPIILPWHRALDQARDRALGEKAIGTTGRGVGPCYEDLVGRRAVLMRDLADQARLEAALARSGWTEKAALLTLLGADFLAYGQVLEYLLRLREKVWPLVGNTVFEIRQAEREGRDILYTLSQSMLLDIVNGSYPYCTSSFCGPGAIQASLGMRKFDRIIGVAKAYTTHVGNGPFPTELKDSTGERLRTLGNERGTITGRDRRTGWLDAVALKYSCQQAGATEMFINKLDILSGFHEISVCTEYRNGPSVQDVDYLDAEIMAKAIPVYKHFHGWKGDLTECRYKSHLPSELRTFIDFLSESLRIPVSGFGFGPHRGDIFWF